MHVRARRDTDSRTERAASARPSGVHVRVCAGEVRRKRGRAAKGGEMRKQRKKAAKERCRKTKGRKKGGRETEKEGNNL